ncbi:MAG: DUF5615 family PIN-like protein [Candidatus Electrothrix sp. Rat3]|nr:DUF5615 family PIN-like protein [Candidatus Electrothrix rattekaaiensis]
MNAASDLSFLVDVGVGKAIEEYLQEEGYDTKAVRDVDPCMEDEEIIRLAHSEKRMVVTMDKDFGELVYHSSMKHCGVLLLRLEDAASHEKLQVIQFIMEHYFDRIRNCFCVFKNDKFRIKKIK